MNKLALTTLACVFASSAALADNMSSTSQNGGFVIKNNLTSTVVIQNTHSSLDNTYIGEGKWQRVTYKQAQSIKTSTFNINSMGYADGSSCEVTMSAGKMPTSVKAVNATGVPKMGCKLNSRQQIVLYPTPKK